MVLQKGTGPGGQPIVEDSAAPGVPVTDLSADGGDIIASCAEWIDSHHVKLDAVPTFGANVATWLATPSSANLLAAVTDETGTGALVFATSPVLVTPNLGTPSAGVLSSCTGYEGSAVKSTGETGAVKYLREDGDNSSSWQEPQFGILPRGYSRRVTSAGVVTDYPPSTIDGSVPDDNGTALQTAITALANGDTLVTGPGQFNTENQVIAEDNFNWYGQDSLIKRTDSTNAVSVVKFTGDNVSLSGRITFDANRTNNKSAWSAGVNEHHAVELVGGTNYYFGPGIKFQNCGAGSATIAGYGLEASSFGFGLYLDGCQFENCVAMRIRARSAVLRNIRSINPSTFDVTTVADQAARLLTNPGQWGGVFQTDNRTYYTLTGTDYTNNSHWTDSSSIVRHLDVDAASVQCDNFEFRGGYFYSDRYATVVTDFGNTVECRRLLVDGLTFVNTIRPWLDAQSDWKIDWCKDATFRNCFIEGNESYSLNLFSGGTSVPKLRIEDSYFAGPIDCTGSRYDLISIKNSTIGGANVGDTGSTAAIQQCLEQVNAKKLCIEDSWLGGGSTRCIQMFTFTGAHDGANDAAILTDSGESWAVDGLIGRVIHNNTDGSRAVITDNTATTVTHSAGLFGGTDNDWDTGDTFTILGFEEDELIIKNSTLAANGASTAYGVVSYSSMKSVLEDVTVDNAGAGGMRLSNSSWDRIRLTSHGGNPDTYEFNSDLGTPTDAVDSDVHPTPNQDPPFGKWFWGLENQRVINYEQNDDSFWQNEWVWDATDAEWKVDGQTHVIKKTTTTAAAEVVCNIATVNDRAYIVNAHAIAVRTSDYAEVGAYKLAGVFKNDGGTLTEVAAPTLTVIGEDTAGWTFDADASGTNIRILATGGAYTVHWVVRLEITTAV